MSDDHLNEVDLMLKMAEIRPELSLEMIQNAYDVIIDAMSETLANGDEVFIRHLGAIRATRNKGSVSTSPFTDGLVTRPPRVFYRFNATRIMKNTLNRKLRDELECCTIVKHTQKAGS